MKSSASFFEAARVAIDSLRASKLRSFLTLLGIILSTTTLISVMSVINGLENYIATSATTTVVGCGGISTTTGARDALNRRRTSTSNYYGNVSSAPCRRRN